MQTFDILQQENDIVFNNNDNKIRIKQASECIDSLVELFASKDLAAEVSTSVDNNYVYFHIVINDFVTEVLSKHDYDFMELCLLCDSFIVSGINYDERTTCDDDEDERTGIIMTFTIRINV